MEPADVVRDFLATIERRDFDAAFAMVTEDLVYDNVPVPAIHGAAQARAWLEAFLEHVAEIEWTIHRLIADGDVVMTERLDRFRFKDRWVDLPVAGVFELRDGRISLWRDYFDFQTALGATQPQA